MCQKKVMASGSYKLANKVYQERDQIFLPPKMHIPGSGGLHEVDEIALGHNRKA